MIERVRTPGSVLYGTLAAFPIACFTAALFTDIAYSQTSLMMWSDFSDWLLALGAIVGGMAAIVCVVGLIGRYAWRPSWPGMIGGLVVLVLAAVDNLVHSRDAWTSVVPTGLLLSASIVLVMLLTGLLASRQRLQTRTIEVRP